VQNTSGKATVEQALAATQPKAKHTMDKMWQERDQHAKKQVSPEGRRRRPYHRRCSRMGATGQSRERWRRVSDAMELGQGDPSMPSRCRPPNGQARRPEPRAFDPALPNPPIHRRGR